MWNVIRVVVLIGMGVGVGASATAPGRHSVRKAKTIQAGYDPTWAAVVDVFAERDWTITNMEKDSGLITTDWMGVTADTPYADCGGSGIASVRATQVRFNVLVREQDDRATVRVNTSFRQLRSFDGREILVDCTSRGGLEREIHLEVARRATRAQRRTPEHPAAAPPPSFYCTAAPADPNVAACARSEAGCAKRQAELVEAIGDATPCTEQRGAACFRATGVDAGTIESCHPSLEACMKRLERAREESGFDELSGCAPVS